ncbi:MAG: hypothetical protein CML68_18900 [Rhodobacteraceae bacterium]|nr:hypothetical protein [Paracoccaceae bacterium]
MAVPPPRQPVFVDRRPKAVLRTLAGDFFNYTLVQLYYPYLWLVAAPAALIDRRFGTGLCDRAIRFAEWLDE